ncbi:MAG: glycosyltransferase [Rhodothermaceae bacterium]|nr:glycosyltransferase [Rhodothermaceae bacterium]MXZ58596.1 glycosyltransferase [Rhodothermaceae bacterium]MYB89974.1 glycosyltransferase [Rhodothermaceae bacterium]MYD67745.1 glycosyltransferase [Rhodothermaceae bacterium]MYG43715.1 glycosyltransferase [Rhodothermaceae bacterium]
MKGRALIVFARSLKSGQVKSRLTKLISAQEATDLYRMFLVDSLKQYASLNVAVRLYMSDGIPPDIPVYGAVIKQQCGKELGERMRHAFQETAAAGYRQMVIIGTDHPTLPDAFIQDAFHALSDLPSICIGPTEDGGYYLLGMNPFIDGLFDDMIYSRPDVFELTLTRAYQSGANVVQLPKWYDVDTPDDLRRLASEEEAVPINTLKIVKQLKAKYAL